MIKQRQEILQFALRLAKAAEAEILPLYQQCSVSHKADGTEVTEADRKAEAVIRNMISDRFPSHTILGEEFGGERSSMSTHQWIVDPLDGTAWFALGMPLFGTLIAYLEEGEPKVGVIHFPVLGETVYAGTQLGCWFQRGESSPIQVHVRSGAPIGEATLSASGVHGSNVVHSGGSGDKIHLTPVLEKAGKFRFCGDCMQHALVCRGSIHAAIDSVMQPWDTAALIPCVEEAGGIATTLSGQREGIVFGGNLLTSCDQALHDELLSVLQGSPSS